MVLTGHLAEDMIGMPDEPPLSSLVVLSPRCQHLLAMLVANPPVSCADISATLGFAANSIGPFRRWCLDALRHRLPLAPVISGETRTP